MRIRTTLTAAAAAASLFAGAGALGAGTAAAAPSADTTTATPGSLAAATTQASSVPAGLIPFATSWPTTEDGVALAYASRDAGATPYLFITGDGGRDWRELPTPPVPFPSDNDTPDMLWSGGVLAISNGTQVTTTLDGRHWAPVAAPAGDDVAKMAAADGVLYALLTHGTETGTTYTETEGLYATPIFGHRFAPVPGVSTTGGGTYGDLVSEPSGVGGLQVSLGHDYQATSYWESPYGYGLRAAPAPCPAADQTLLGGPGRPGPVALCSGSPSNVGPGEDTQQVYTAPRLGAAFTASGPEEQGPNQEAFAAASDTTQAVASAAGLYVTFDGGKTFSQKVADPNGSFWMDLAFEDPTTGTADVTTVNDQLKIVGSVERTTDGGHTWAALTLP